MRNSLFILATLVALLPPAGRLQAAYDSAEAAKQKDLTIIRVTPTGEDVPAERQIVITFNRPVVPLGRMERDKAEIPVTISPPVECEWRWINPSSLACQLTEKESLKKATRYELTVKPGLKAEDGTTIAETYTDKFITERPDATYTWFKTWRSPGTPVIRITFNQPVTKSSVEKALSFAGGGNGNSSGAQGPAVTVNPDPDDSDPPQLVPVPGEKSWFIFGKQEKRKSDDQLAVKDGEEARRIWLAEPATELPLDTNIVLKLANGIVSALGPEPGVHGRDLVAFDTYPEFAFLGVHCRGNDEADIDIKPGESPGDRKCNPMSGAALLFSAPVQRSQVRKYFAFTPRLGGEKAQDEIWGEESEESTHLDTPHEKGKNYSVWLPYGLKAATDFTAAVKPAERGMAGGAWAWVKALFSPQPETDIEDEFGRKLMKPETVRFATDHRKPNFELDHHEAVIEKSVDSEVPFYVNNLGKFSFEYRSLTAEGAKDHQTRDTSLPDAKDVQFAVPFGVREALGGKTGVLYGHLDTEPHVDKGGEPAYRLFAEVTPWQLHVKLGHFSTLVWVTSMANGAPVEGATIVFYKDSIAALSAPTETLGTAVTDKDGLAQLPGTSEADPELALQQGYEDGSDKLFVKVEKDGDLAVMPLNQDFVIDTYRASNENIYPSSRKKYGHILAWGTTAQGIYRAGDTIQYKFYVRDQDDRTLKNAPKEGYKLEIVDPMDNVAATVDKLVLNDFGAFDGSFTVAKEAPVGWYRFRLTGNFAAHQGDSDEQGEYSEEAGGEAKSGTWYPLRVLVSDFTPVPFHVESQLNGDRFGPDQEVSAQASAKLHSGGPYADAQLRTTAILEEREFSSKNPVAAGFTFSLPDAQTHGSKQVYQKIEPLDSKGEHTAKFRIGKQDFAFGRLTVESAVQDERGKYVAAESGADFVGVDRFVGMKSPDWAYESKKPVGIQYLVTDETGAPVKGVKVAVTFTRQETVAARVKGGGNAYITNYTTEWKPAGTCDGASGEGAEVCSFTPDKSGSYRAVAKIQDTQGREHGAGVEFYVTGDDYVLWNNESDVLLPIVPEKPTWHVGDKARYLIKNPYPGAKALVTIERYGIIDRFVKTLDGSTPVLEFEVKPDYLPGFYLSVLVVSPRVDKPLEKGQVDLGKPSFRMGYVTVPVKDPYKEMKVTAKAAADVYRPRDKVSVQIHAEPRMKDKDEPIELAVAVLDESVFDLVAEGVKNFDPYEGFYKLAGLDVINYDLLTRLIGRQKFEKKGANPGGDGGADLKIRDLFKFVAYWNPSLKADAQGNAALEFEAPDNLTGWRVLALAVTPSDRLGLGQGNFKVNRPTEVRGVMPNQVTERDRFKAGFSVMNRTDKPRTLQVKIKASGLIDTSKTPDTHEETVMLEPYKRATVFMDVQTEAVPETRDEPQGSLKFEVRAWDKQDGDGLVMTLPVNKFRSLETAADYGTTTQDKATTSIQFPDNIFPDIGSVSVVLAPSVIGAVEGAFKYIRNYAYLCWEQKLTKGVMASHYLQLKQYIPDDFTWPEAKDLPQTSLDEAAAFQAPNGGMTYFLARDEYVDPYLSAYTALGFNWLREAGYNVPGPVEEKLHGYLLNMLKNDVLPTFYDEGMSSTVRAVALAALATDGKITRADLERYKPHVPQMSLFGKTHFLLATLKVKDSIGMAKDVANDIFAHANQTGGKFIFNETLDDSYQRMLSSPLRENCAILDVFTAYGETKEGASIVSDAPFKLVRAITQDRKGRDHWENTQENMFCMKALVDYSQIYEKVKPNMTVSASLNGTGFGEAKFADLRDQPKTLERPITAADVGTKATVELDRKGDGRLYYATRLRYAPRSDFSKPENAGIELHREYSVEKDGKWELLKTKDHIARGDLVRVDLYVSLPAARNFVAVNDPVPGGLEPVNRELGTASKVDADKGEFQAAGGSWFFKFKDWEGYNVSRWSFYHQELRHDNARFFADYLPPGNYHLSYTAQAIAEGTFTVMPPLAEEMYDPDVYGKDVTGELGVEAKAVEVVPEKKDGEKDKAEKK